jgi:hypothetical protein
MKVSEVSPLPPGRPVWVQGNPLSSLQASQDMESFVSVLQSLWGRESLHWSLFFSLIQGKCLLPAHTLLDPCWWLKDKVHLVPWGNGGGMRIRSCKCWGPVSRGSGTSVASMQLSHQVESPAEVRSWLWGHPDVSLNLTHHVAWTLWGSICFLLLCCLNQVFPSCCSCMGFTKACALWSLCLATPP